MTKENQSVLTLQIIGLHCRSCELLLEEKFSQVKNVTRSEVDFRRGLARIYFENDGLSRQELESIVVTAGYGLGRETPVGIFSRDLKDYKNLLSAFIIGLIIYFFLRSFGLGDGFDLNLQERPFEISIAIIIGLTAGFSSCLALVGGLVVGLSAKYAVNHPEAKAIQKFRPHLFFNLGRIVGYGIFGGLLGSLGSVFQLAPLTTGLITIIAGLIMLLVGSQLIHIFPGLNKIKLAWPKSLARWFGVNTEHQAEYSHRHAIVLGALTFFLPCGFTQAMQLNALASGHFWSGALIMSLFALGTTVGLLSLGGLTALIKGQWSRLLFALIGLLVIGFGLINILNGLTLVGIRSNMETKNSIIEEEKSDNVQIINGEQVVTMTVGKFGYTPNTFVIKKNLPTRWIIKVESAYSCGNSLIASVLGIQKNLRLGENVFTFTPVESGEINFSCSMGMYRGKFIVK